MCGFGSRDKIVAVATNTIGAKEYDEVELELEGSQVVRAAAIVYLIPVAFLLAGLYFGTVFASFIGRPDMAHVASAVLGFGLLGLVYAGIATYSRHPAISKYQAKVIRILGANEHKGSEDEDIRDKL